MTISRQSKRVWHCLLVCFALCCMSFLAFAQERSSEPPKQETTQEKSTVIRGKTTKPEPRAASGYLKIGDIKGDTTTEAKPKIPAHTPEWTDVKTGDPGRTATDDKHKDWINLDSMNSPRPPDSGMKIKAADQTPRYKCGQEGGECHCSGVLDCKNLWSSGDCKANTEWEDGNDNSKGGCIEK